MGLHQTEGLLHSKGNYQQNEMTTSWMKRENICKSYLVKDWYPKYKKTHTIWLKPSNPTKKWAEDLNRHFPKDIQVDEKILNIFSSWSGNYKPKPLLEWLSSKRQEITSSDEHVEKREPLCTAGESVNWHNHYRKQWGVLKKNKKQIYHIIQQFHFRVFIWAGEEGKKEILILNTQSPAMFTVHYLQ